MMELLPELKPIDLALVKEYKAMRKKYESVFGEYDPFARTAGPMADRIKEMSDRLEDYYRQQAQSAEKRKHEMATA